MRKTLYIKFILGYLLFGLFGFIVVATFVNNLLVEHCRHKQADKLYAEATLIANTYASDLYNSEVSLTSVQRQLSSLSVFLDSTIWILNPSGRLVVSSSEDVNTEAETYVEGFNPLISTGNNYAEGDFFNSFSEPHISVIAPITNDFKIKGYVTIHSPSSLIKDEAASLLNISYLTLFMILLLSLIILIFFTEIVYIPLRKITVATEQYASGNMHYRFTVDSDDEIGYLGATLSYMADEIARAEDDQKKFVANVSHDFRSPLTSIHGFLEAMLDGTIPPEQHEKYLNIVLQETDRLTNLTNSLLTLNNLNTKGIYLSLSDFDINEVVRGVAQSFEQVCRFKSVSMKLVLLGDALFVNADLEKIQQVLYNLVDNAIKFSAQGGTVTIETEEKKNKVFVSVKDNGIGIPKEDQKLIWDRFYKTDLSRGKDKKGTGLGLSIVREIIRSHSENINLVSTEGVGSDFTFTLKRSELNDQFD